MRKTLKISLSLLIVSVFTAISVFQFNAASYLIQDGFTYEPVANQNAVIYGYDNRNLDVSIPYKLGDSYVSEIGKYAFMNNSSITSVSFSNAKMLSKLNSYSFANCTQITSIVLPIWINEISVSTFQGCTSLASITIYSNLDTIPNQAFYNCQSLDNVRLPETVNSIGNYAFGECNSLSSIYIPKTTTSISANAFRNCSNLTIHGEFGSYAEQYAEENNIPFVGTTTHKIGDVDLDGYVNVKDATLVQSYSASIIELKGESLVLADVNGDGSVNIIDATEIQKIAVEM